MGLLGVCLIPKPYTLIFGCLCLPANSKFKIVCNRKIKKRKRDKNEEVYDGERPIDVPEYVNFLSIKASRVQFVSCETQMPFCDKVCTISSLGPALGLLGSINSQSQAA